MPQTTPERGYEYPCYSDLANFPAQMQTFAEDVDADVQTVVDDYSTLPPALIFHRSTDLSVPNNTDTAISWVDTPPIPPFWSAGSVITIPTAAIWLVTFTCMWAQSDPGYRRGEIRRLLPTSTPYAADVRDSNNVVSDVFVRNVVTVMIGAAAGTTLEARVRQTSGGALTMFEARIALTKVSE